MTRLRRRGYYPGGSAGGAHYEYPTLGDRAASPTIASGRRRLPSLSSLSSARTGDRAQSSSYVVTRRTGQGRRLPATPTHPTTLNIDALGNVSSSQQQTGSAVGSGGGGPPRGRVGGDRINFPKLEPSPSRAAIRTGAGVVSRAEAGARLPQAPPLTSVPATADTAGKQGISLRSMMMSHGAVDPEATPEMMSGRGGGGRKLPRVGPEHLASAGSGGIMGRGNASTGGIRRELPRPGTTIGFRY